MLKFLDPISAFIPRSVRSLIGLSKRPNLGCVLRPGGLGDLVVATLAAINLNIDIWRIVWVVEKRNKAWCEYLKLPFICYDQGSGALLAFRSREGFAWVIDTEQRHGLSACFACRLTSKDGIICGFKTSRGAHLFDLTVDHPLAFSHEVKAFESLFEAASQKIPLPRIVGESPLGMLLPKVEQGNSAVIAIGGRQSVARSVPLEDWLMIVNVAREQSKDIILVGSAIDTKFSVELMAASPEIRFNYVGRLEFHETVALIRQAKVVVGIDSGLIHVASFFQKRTIGIFTDETMRQRWSPLAQGSEAHMLSDIRVRYGS